MASELLSVLGKLRHQWQRRQWMYAENMPGDLRTAALLLSETVLTANSPVPFVGKPDQVYLMTNGHVLPVETKTHGAVRPSDIVQLRMYGTLLRNTKDPRVRSYPTASHGYLRLSTPAGVVYSRVELSPADDLIVQAWLQWHLLKHRFSSGVHIPAKAGAETIATLRT